MKRYHVNKEGQLVFSTGFGGDDKTIQFKIPSKVVALGSDSVEKYVKRQIQEINKQRQKEEVARKAKWNAINISISVKHEGVELRGKITSAKVPKGLYKVSLDLPEEFVGTTIIYGSFGRALSGYNSWYNIDTSTLADWALVEAQLCLLDIYQEKEHMLKHKKIIKLMEDLNRNP